MTNSNRQKSIKNLQMNWLLALLILLGFATKQKASAQEVIYSAYEKFDLRSGDFSVVGKSNGKLYTYRGSSDGFFLDAYNDSMEKLATVVLDFFPKKIYETRFVAYNDQIIILYQSLESNRVIQYAALLDGDGHLKKGPLKLDEAKTGIFGPSREYFSSVVSENKQNIVIYAAVAKGEELQFKGIWLDPQLNILKKSNTTFKADNDLSIGESLLANDGRLYFSVYNSVGNRNYADQLWMLRLDSNERQFRAVDFPLNAKYASAAYMKMDNVNNRVYIGGFWSEKKNGNFEGVIFGYYDVAAAELQNRKMIAFDERLKNASGERNTKRAFNDYQVKQLIVKNDGGFVMISEDYFMTTRNSYTPGWGYYSYYYGPFSAPSIREYHYNDVLALSYDGNGTREWHAFVRKEQYSQEDGGIFSSYALLNTGGTLGLLFNDFNRNHSTVQLATIDGEGAVAMQSFAAQGNNEPDWLPRSGKQVSSREIVIPCMRRKQICFAKVVF